MVCMVGFTVEVGGVYRVCVCLRYAIIVGQVWIRSCTYLLTSYLSILIPDSEAKQTQKNKMPRGFFVFT